MSTSSDKESRWLYPAHELKNTPSIKRGMTEHEELTHRQTAACLIRKIGQKLKDYCKINSSIGLSTSTAMVYMHRFYMFHPFQKYPAAKMAPCALFLAAKVEDMAFKLDYVIKATHLITAPNSPPLTENQCKEMHLELIKNENLLLQTLGFDLIITHPHTSVIESGGIIGASKTVIKLAYELAINSLHFTTMCLRYEPTTVASVCLHMAFKRYNLSPGCSIEGKDWWYYLNPKLKIEDIEEITKEFLKIIEKCKVAFNKWVSLKTPQQENECRPSVTSNHRDAAHSSTSRMN